MRTLSLRPGYRLRDSPVAALSPAKKICSNILFVMSLLNRRFLPLMVLFLNISYDRVNVSRETKMQERDGGEHEADFKTSHQWPYLCS